MDYMREMGSSSPWMEPVFSPSLTRMSSFSLKWRLCSSSTCLSSSCINSLSFNRLRSLVLLKEGSFEKERVPLTMRWGSSARTRGISTSRSEFFPMDCRSGSLRFESSLATGSGVKSSRGGEGSSRSRSMLVRLSLSNYCGGESGPTGLAMRGALSRASY